MTEFRILPAAEGHAVAMAPHLRPADADEVYATSGRSAEAALLSALRRSTQAWTCLVDGELACMWGVGPLSLVAGKGCPWLLGTRAVEQRPMTFLRQSRAFLREMLETYSQLENHVDARNALSIRWLKWLGFTIEPAAPYGFLGLPFHRFWMSAAGDRGFSSPEGVPPERAGLTDMEGAAGGALTIAHEATQEQAHV